MKILYLLFFFIVIWILSSWSNMESWQIWSVLGLMLVFGAMAYADGIREDTDKFYKE